MSSKDLLKTRGDTSWFVKDRFGLFIHWGLYSMGARHEWLKNFESITSDVYDSKYFKHFDPDLYDPEKWAAAADAAGMKYFVITTKHHEGFALWDSKVSNYKATKTPAKRDLLRPMVDAFRSKGIKVGFYHSLIDWHHEQYVVDTRNHPQREDIDLLKKMNKGRDQKKYADYLHAQVKELLSKFGKVDVLWFDFSFVDKDNRLDFSKGKGREAWRSEELYRMIRKMQPEILINDRLDIEGMFGDMKTPEQFQPRGCVTVNGKPVVWEACQTMSGSWGYHRDEATWRSTRQLISTLIDCVSKDGNLLLNIGPTSRGEFDCRAMDRLQGIGKWMHHHSRSIYSCTSAPAKFAAPENCKLTYNPEKKRLYVHILDWPYKHLHLDGKAYKDQVEYAQLLHDGSEVLFKGLEPWQQPHDALSPRKANPETQTLTLPQIEPPVEIPVVELFLK